MKQDIRMAAAVFQISISFSKIVPKQFKKQAKDKELSEHGD